MGRPNEELDSSTQGKYLVTVTATDRGGLFTSTELEVRVTWVRFLAVHLIELDLFWVFHCFKQFMLSFDVFLDFYYRRNI